MTLQDYVRDIDTNKKLKLGSVKVSEDDLNVSVTFNDMSQVWVVQMQIKAKKKIHYFTYRTRGRYRGQLYTMTGIPTVFELVKPELVDTTPSYSVADRKGKVISNDPSLQYVALEYKFVEK